MNSVAHLDVHGFNVFVRLHGGNPITIKELQYAVRNGSMNPPLAEHLLKVLRFTATAFGALLGRNPVNVEQLRFRLEPYVGNTVAIFCNRGGYQTNREAILSACAIVELAENQYIRRLYRVSYVVDPQEVGTDEWAAPKRLEEKAGLPPVKPKQKKQRKEPEQAATRGERSQEAPPSGMDHGNNMEVAATPVPAPIQPRRSWKDRSRVVDPATDFVKRMNAPEPQGTFNTIGPDLGELMAQKMAQKMEEPPEAEVKQLSQPVETAADLSERERADAEESITTVEPQGS